MQQRKVGIYSQEAGWGAVGGKLLRGDIRGKGGFWVNQRDRQAVRATILRLGGEEFDQIERMGDFH